MNYEVALIMGSDSDWKVMEDAHNFLIENGVSVFKRVLSAHRTPHELPLFAKFCEESGVKIIIAGAGGAAHLPGMMAAFSPIPVIGVPVDTTPLKGVDALYSIVQMPKGIPVATVAINNSYNAGVLALSIIASFDAAKRESLNKFRRSMSEASLKKRLD